MTDKLHAAALAIDDAQTLYNQYVDFLDRFNDGAFSDDEAPLELRLNEQVVERFLAALVTSAEAMDAAGLGDARDEQRIAKLHDMRASGTSTGLSAGGNALAYATGMTGALGALQGASVMSVPDHSEPYRKTLTSMRDRLPREHQRSPREPYADERRRWWPRLPSRQDRALRAALVAVVAWVLAVVASGSVIGGLGQLVGFIATVVAGFHLFIALLYRERSRPRMSWSA